MIRSALSTVMRLSPATTGPCSGSSLWHIMRSGACIWLPSAKPWSMWIHAFQDTAPSELFLVCEP